MHSDALLLVKEFDPIDRQAGIQQLPDQRVRCAVKVARQFDVRIGCHAPLGQPFRVFVARARQRLERGLIQRRELRAPRARELAEGAVIEFVEQLADGLIKFGEREELPFAQARQNPALNHLHADFSFRFVTWLVGARRHGGRPVVGEHFGVSAIEFGLVAAGFGHGCLQVVGHDEFRHAAEEFKGTDVGGAPIGQRL